MQGIETVALLFVSNIFMTLAWYGHLRLQQSGVSSNWPLMCVVVFSWGIAFFEYCFQVPANRLGFNGNGGPFSLVQLKVIQECVSLIVFATVANILFQGQTLHWNHAAAFLCLVAAVYFVFME
ncbi:MAG: DMT family protein [Prevotella sp.]|nr:DMT family protein [Prevotella sp.]